MDQRSERLRADIQQLNVICEQISASNSTSDQKQYQQLPVLIADGVKIYDHAVELQPDFQHPLFVTLANELVIRNADFMLLSGIAYDEIIDFLAKSKGDSTRMDWRLVNGRIDLLRDIQTLSNALESQQLAAILPQVDLINAQLQPLSDKLRATPLSLVAKLLAAGLKNLVEKFSDEEKYPELLALIEGLAEKTPDKEFVLQKRLVVLKKLIDYQLETAEAFGYPSNGATPDYQAAEILYKATQTLLADNQAAFIKYKESNWYSDKHYEANANAKIMRKKMKKPTSASANAKAKEKVRSVLILDEAAFAAKILTPLAAIDKIAFDVDFSGNKLVVSSQSQPMLQAFAEVTKAMMTTGVTVHGKKSTVTLVFNHQKNADIFLDHGEKFVDAFTEHYQQAIAQEQQRLEQETQRHKQAEIELEQKRVELERQRQAVLDRERLARDERRRQADEARKVRAAQEQRRQEQRELVHQRNRERAQGGNKTKDKATKPLANDNASKRVEKSRPAPPEPRPVAASPPAKLAANGVAQGKKSVKLQPASATKPSSSQQASEYHAKPPTGVKEASTHRSVARQLDPVTRGVTTESVFDLQPKKRLIIRAIKDVFSSVLICRPFNKVDAVKNWLSIVVASNQVTLVFEQQAVANGVFYLFDQELKGQRKFAVQHGHYSGCPCVSVDLNDQRKLDNFLHIMCSRDNGVQLRDMVSINAVSRHRQDQVISSNPTAALPKQSSLWPHGWYDFFDTRGQGVDPYVQSLRDQTCDIGFVKDS